MSPVFVISQLKWPVDGFSCHQCYHSAEATNGWVFMSPVFVIVQLKWPVGGFLCHTLAGFSCHQCLLSFIWSDQWMGFHVTSVCYHSAEVTSRWVLMSYLSWKPQVTSEVGLYVTSVTEKPQVTNGTQQLKREDGAVTAEPNQQVFNISNNNNTVPSSSVDVQSEYSLCVCLSVSLSHSVD